MKDKFRNWLENNTTDLTGKTAVVTGANSGLGKETTKFLAMLGAKVIMACRNTSKAEQAKEEILKNPGLEISADQLEIVELDLSDIESVRRAGEEIADNYPQLNILVNNAGIMAIPFQENSSGIEMQFATNHLGHFEFTKLLWKNLLESGGQARIVNVSSLYHKAGNIEIPDISHPQNYKPFQQYGNTKLANLLFSFSLQEKIISKGLEKEILVASTHPGYSNTNLQVGGPAMSKNPVVKFFVGLLNKLVAQSAAMGSLPSVLAAAGEVEMGAFYGPKAWGGLRGFPKKNYLNPKLVNAGNATKLWSHSEDLSGSEFEI